MNISTLPKYKSVSRPALGTLVCLFSTFFSYGQFGVLDSTFGTGGVVTGGINGFDNYAYSVAVQPDGKILVGGETSYDQGSTYTREMLITRYNTDGSLDLTFGNGGMDTTDFPQADNGGCSIAIQADGKIVLAGYSGAGNLTLLRYNSDGQPDATFGQNGIAVYNLSFEPSLGPHKLRRCRTGVS